MMEMYYYISIVSVWAITFFILKIVFSESEGRRNKKNHNIVWFIYLDHPFQYNRLRNLIWLCVLSYMLTSMQHFFSVLWFIECFGFITVGILTDALGQVCTHYYTRWRFGDNIKYANALYQEMREALLHPDYTEVHETDPTYALENIVSRHMDMDDHVAIVSRDGGDFVSGFKNLPPLTYVVESNVTKAMKKLENKEVKVTSYTKYNTLPFKDERMDILVNVLSSYDKSEAYRVLKSGGYLIIDQIGSDNYKEIVGTIVPYQITQPWNRDVCCQELSDIGMEIVDSMEEQGYIRFQSLTSFFAFVHRFSPERIEHFERYINFYAKALEEIKKNKFYDITTHRFVVIAKKP